MKKLIFTLTVLLIGLNVAFSQQIPRENVLVEIGTGTWCQYCPGAAMGADDLVANGHDVVIIENHNGDSYTNTASNARNSYYNITGYPTTVFDGGSAYVGGSNTTSLYPQYLQRYNQKINIPTSFSIDIEGTSAGFIDFNVDVTIEMVDPYAGSDIRLHCAITESDIEQNWQGMSHLNFVQRMMVPDHNGIPLDFSAGNVIVQNLSFGIETDWLPENCEFVIFLQEHGTKEVLNATKRDLMEFSNINDYDASLSKVSNIPEKSCTGSFAPSVLLRNNGNEDLTSLTISYQVNDGSLNTLDWTGTLAFLEEETVELPLVTFTPAEENSLMIYSENPNGNPDQFPLSDTIIDLIPEADITPTPLTLFFRCDNYPEETTWKLLDNEGSVVYEGGPYSTPGHTFTEEFILDDFSCYQFYVYDAGGNGLNSPGFFALFHTSDNYIIQGSDDFDAVIGTDFTTDNSTGLDDQAMSSEVVVYPNPFSNYTNIAFTTREVSHIRVNMYDAFGEIVYKTDEGMITSGKQLIKIEGKEFINGIYIIQLLVNDQIITKKITIAH
ncbi:MAG: Omp28-related outer membrane protein [Bacteroidetes bacterium]|nr:Omp28-related outer membrane protein [Bacteroidota bacterium]